MWQEELSISKNFLKGGTFTKKYLIALTVALMVCLLGVSASAETEEVEAYKTAAKEQEAIIDVYSNVMNEMDPDELDLKTCIEIMTKAYEDAGWTVIQESPEVARSADIDPKILELAYSDIDKASQEQKEKIIEAREIVINHSSWVNDIEAQGIVGYMQNMADREITFTPPYSELFPGWDPPRPVKVENNIVEALISEDLVNMVTRDLDTRIYYDGNYVVPKAGTSTLARDLCSVPIYQPMKNKIETWAVSTNVPTLTRINVGYNNGETGMRLVTREDIPIGIAYVCETDENSVFRKINPCVSTHKTSGEAHMKVRRTLIPKTN